MANELGQLVANAESPLDGYLAYHNPNNPPRLRAERLEKLTSMSIEDVMSMLEKNYNHYGAVGKYQITYPLLKDALHDRHLKLNAKAHFTPEVQEHIYSDYIISRYFKGVPIKAYITAPPDVDAHASAGLLNNAILGSAHIWSAIKYQDGNKDQGVFDTHGTQSKISSAQAGAALTAMRTNYWEAIHRGASPEDAWHVTTGIKPMPTQSIHDPDPYAEPLSPYGPASSPSQSHAPGQSLRQSPGSHLPIDPNDPFDQLYLASVTGDRQAFSRVAQNYLNSPEGQEFLQLGRDFNAQQLAEQQAREQVAQQEQEQMHHQIRMTR